MKHLLTNIIYQIDHCHFLLETEIKTKDFRTAQIKMEQEKINAKIAIFDVRLNQIKKQLFQVK